MWLAWKRGEGRNERKGGILVRKIDFSHSDIERETCLERETERMNEKTETRREKEKKM